MSLINYLQNKKKSTALFILLITTSILAFGQNKVQYTNFTWRYLPAKNYDVYFHQDQDSLPYIAYKWIENDINALCKSFKFTIKEKIPIVLFGSPNLFEQTNVITEIIPEGVGGFTELFKNRVVIPYNGSYPDLRHVLHHELVHAIVFLILNDQPGNSVLSNTAAQMPLWFMEGAAEFLSSKWDIEADMFMMDMVINSSVPLPGYELGGFLAYKGGQSFLFFLWQSYGPDRFDQFLQEFKKAKTIDNAIKKVYGKPLNKLGLEWHQELKRLYWPEIGHRKRPEINATPITSHIETRDNYNLRPRISPDGSKVAFFSDRKDYTGIVITDKKGKVLHEISQNGYGGFFESFHPFRSGMCWSPDGSQLCFVTKDQGKDKIRIVDIKRKKLVLNMDPDLASVTNPDWSNDGNLLTFVGVKSGLSDIYTYDLKTKKIDRLTKDLFTKGDPRFSPDNKEIIFSIQDTSGKVSISKSAWGETPSDLAIVNISTKIVRRLWQTPYNEKQACYSKDGKKILFSSDKNGIDNLYIAPIDSFEAASPLTNYVGGCTHPDWDKNNSTLVFTLFQKQGWDIWSIENPLKDLKPDSLPVTNWVLSHLDTSKPFFHKTIIKEKPDSLKKFDSTSKRKETIKSQPDKKNKDITISEEIDSTKVGSNKDSLTIKNSQVDSLTNKQRTDSSTIVKDSAKVDLIPKLMAKSDSTKNDTTANIKQPKDIPSHPYKLKFSPDLVGLGVGINTFYGYAGQFVLGFSDVMGDHRITVAGDIQGNFQDYIHLFGSYAYLKRRLNFGIGGFYNKDIYYYLLQTSDTTYVELQSRDLNFGGFLSTSYPFSRYSRIDFNFFMQHYERVNELYSEDDLIGNTVLPNLQYSYDNILWGITGPLNGIRGAAGLTLSPPLKIVDHDFISGDLDFRMYTHITKRFVWANRLTLGFSEPIKSDSSAKRYFLGGNENWLTPQIEQKQQAANQNEIIYSNIVVPLRGWKYLSFTGERLFLFNTEFRFPFIRQITTVWPLPLDIRYINGAVFCDIGNAWDKDDQYSTVPLPTRLYGGFGYGMRANLGFAVLRFDRGWPVSSSVGKPINYFSLGAEF